MTHSGLTNAIRLSQQYSSRNGQEIDTFLIHHQASTNNEATIDEMVSGSKEVSANYTISNEGLLTLIVDEQYRAWTSGSSTDGGKGAAMDRRSITVEVENQTGDPDWKISPEAYVTLVNLLRDLRKRYNIRFVYGHRDLWLLFQASYPTYCPGPTTVKHVLELEGGAAGSLPAALPTPLPLPAGNPEEIDYAFGLTKAAQLAVQQALARLGRYTGDQDGRFGAMSVRAFQTWLKDNHFLAADYEVDGIPGKVYGLAVQTLAKKFGYTDQMDGQPGASTSASIEKWAAATAHPVAQVRPTAPSGKDWSYWEPTGDLCKRVQRALKKMDRLPDWYEVDGVPGDLFRKAVQHTLNVSKCFVGPEDGKIERGGCYGIQIYAHKFGDYDNAIDGAPRENSWANFALGLERG